jgi:hypothetical protein
MLDGGDKIIGVIFGAPWLNDSDRDCGDLPIAGCPPQTSKKFYPELAQVLMGVQY